MGEQHSLPLLLLYTDPTSPGPYPQGTYLLNSPPVKPSWRQATVASYRDQPWSQMVPTSSSMMTSRRPVLWVPPTRRSCGSGQRQESSYTMYDIFSWSCFTELKCTYKILFVLRIYSLIRSRMIVQWMLAYMIHSLFFFFLRNLRCPLKLKKWQKIKQIFYFRIVAQNS